MENRPPMAARARLAACLLLAAIVANAWAVKPGQWTHQTEADFSAAELTDVIVTNLGDVRLARASQLLAELEGEDSIVYDLQSLPDGRLFAAIGPAGKLVRIDGDRAVTVAEYDGAQLFALASAEQGFWVAVSGSPSRVELRTGDDSAVQRTIELPDVRYIWDMALDGPRLWLATGTKGQLLVIDTSQVDARPVVALDTPHTNLLCLGIDGSGRVYTGSDSEGIVYRVSRGDGEQFQTFALYDAPEPEIGALLVFEDGTVFAGTADVEQAKPGRLEQAQAQQVGRVEPPAPGDLREKVPNVPPKPEPKPEPVPAPQSNGSSPAAVDRPQGADIGGPPANGTNANATVAPTKEQYDQLRAAVQERLERASQGGEVKLQSAPPLPAAPAVQPAGPTAIRSRSGGPPPATSKKGNAIYRISPDGLVREVFREAVVILRLVGSDHGLYAGTGNEGVLYHIDPDAEEVTLLARLGPRQLPALWPGRDGSLLVGSANPGKMVRLDDRYSATGTLRSPTLDAAQISLWGKMTIAAAAPEGTNIEVQTRSGNVNSPDDGQWWSPWSASQVLDTQSSRGYLEVLSPPARYLQYRLTFRSAGEQTPTVTNVALRYLTPNIRPRITSIKTEYPPRPGAEPQPLHTLKISWEAADANADKLVYRVEAREAEAAADAPFVTIARNHSTNSYEWDTRTAADGRYVLRVTASDEPDNVADQALESSRRSDPVAVDNTPPAVEGFTAEVEGLAVRLNAQVNDDLSPIAEARYRVGGSDDWVLVLPDDLIYDSTSERIAVTITGLPRGLVNVTLRATDALGNSRYASKLVKLD